MKPRPWSTTVGLLLLAGSAAVAAPPAGPRPQPSATAPVTPTAGDWRRSCEAYMQALQGVPQGDDLEVTYCLGLTLGLVEGMRLGSQLGALNFGSQMAVRYRLDPGEVFGLFQQRSAGSLLQVCPPEGVGLRAYVTAVHAYIGSNPETATRPVTEVFFEALQAAFPCSVQDG
jgi:hypothetical protein